MTFDPASLASLQAVVISHVHIDHVGRLPWLMAAGYKGPIYCSEPSAKLLPLVLEESLQMGFTRNQRMIRAVIRQLSQQLIALPYQRKRQLWPGVSIKLHRAGHILGSAYISVYLPDGRRMVFSGDLGAPWAPLLPAPRSPWHADWLVLESTYGDRLHQSRRERRQTLARTLRKALRNRGTVLIPAFSLGRSQELLYELEEIIHQAQQSNDKLARLEVIIDSPLAQHFTRLYRDLSPFWDREARQRLRRGRRPLDFANLTQIGSHRAHLQTVDYLTRKQRPAVVIAASGMCNGGRIVNYLKAMLPNPVHDILFIGYQARGTPGHQIQRYGPHGGWVELDGQRYQIRARVQSISGYSAHADQQNLFDFVRRMRQPPERVTLVHGEPEAQQALAKRLQRQWPAMRIEYAGMRALAAQQ